MSLEVGAITTGKVTGITKFGAFVTIAPGRSGLVHISEIASTYVNDVNDHLVIGQQVNVKIIGVDQSNRLNLSIKEAANLPVGQEIEVPEDQQPNQVQAVAVPESPVSASEPTFEDKLKRFMQDSNSKISGLKRNSDKRGSRRRGR